MNENISKAYGDGIIDELAEYGYEAYLNEAQVLLRLINRSHDAVTQTLPIALTSRLNNNRGCVLVALRMRDAIALEAKRVAAQQAAAAADAAIIEATVIKTPGFGEVSTEDSTVAKDPILTDLEDFGAE